MASIGAFTYEKCTQEEWDKIFGKPLTVEEFRRAKAELDAKRPVGDEEHLVAIHGEDAGKRIYGGFDHGLGVTIDPHRARAHRKEMMKAKGLTECG